jgi:hypothetical protein
MPGRWPDGALVPGHGVSAEFRNLACIQQDHRGGHQSIRATGGTRVSHRCRPPPPSGAPTRGRGDRRVGSALPGAAARTRNVPTWLSPLVPGRPPHWRRTRTASCPGCWSALAARSSNLFPHQPAALLPRRSGCDLSAHVAQHRPRRRRRAGHDVQPVFARHAALAAAGGGWCVAPSLHPQEGADLRPPRTWMARGSCSRSRTGTWTPRWTCCSWPAITT